jgi:hypothetical protein
MERGKMKHRDNKIMIGSEEFKSRVVDLCVKSGAEGLPRKQRDRHIVLKSAAMTMDPHRALTVAEVDSALKSWCGIVAQRLDIDHVSMRRALVGEKYLRRDPAGRFYALVDSGPEEPGFSSEVEKVDVFDLALHSVCSAEQARLDQFPPLDSPEGRTLIKARMLARQYLDGTYPHIEAVDELGEMYDEKVHFLRELACFMKGFSVLIDDEPLARKFAARFLESSDEWVRQL